MQTYVPLHNHGHGSTLDGFAKELEHAKKVSKDKGVALGLTDHGTCAQHGALKEACATYGIKPIYGIEAYFVDDVKLSKERKDKPSDFSHGCLWAIDDKGLENLWTLSTISTDKDHMYYKPRMDFELLSKYSEGLAVSDGCLLAEVARAINDDDFDRAEEYLQRMVSIFGRENVFIELHTWQFCNPTDDSQVELNRQMTKANHGKLFLAKKLGLKTIAVNDAHYAEKEDYVYHELVWNSHTSKGADTMSDSLSDTGESLGRGQTASWLMNEEEVRYWLAKHGLPQSAIDESIQNTWDFAQRCTAKIESRIRYPLLTGDEKKDTELFNQTIEKGFKKKVPAGLEEEYRKRVEYEKDVILEKNFEGYFNVVSDFCRYTKESDETGIRGGIPGKQPALLGPARGSAGGSLVSYLMDITEIDPVKHDLPFERFLSRSRGLEQGVKVYFSDHWPLSFKKSSEYYDLDVGDKYLDFKIIAKEPALVGDYPDIDSDFPSSFSGKIIDYLRYKYGNNSVAKVGTAQTSQIRNVFKDLARAHNVEFRKANTISRLFPEDLGPHYFESEDSLEGLFEEVPELREYSELLSQIAPHLNKMLGRVRQYGSHASGYIVTNYSLIGKTPMRYKDGELVTQFDLSELAKCGFVKYDILKIKALDIIQDALETAVLDKVVGKRIIDGVPVYRNISEVDDPENYTIVTEFTPDILYYGVNKELDDPGVWKGTREGDSLGIFQLETSGGTRMAQNMQIQNLDDAAVLSAVNRPGMTRSGLANKYFKRRRGDEPVEYPHPQLEKIVGKTYGFFVFQEDVMRLFTEMAGYSLEESDAVRKTVTKKDFEGMLVLKERFLDHIKASPTFLEQMPDKYSSVEDCFNEIWAMMEHTVAYSFNSSHCLHGMTNVTLESGEVIFLAELARRYKAGEQLRILSMMPDGSVAPNDVAEVIDSGTKPLKTIVLEDGRILRATKKHRFLTTEGYKAVEELLVGDELIYDGKSSQRNTALSNTMKETQSKITFEERSIHQKNVQKMHPDRCKPWKEAAVASIKELRKDPDWHEKWRKACSEGQKEYWSNIEDKVNARNWKGWTFFKSWSEEDLDKWKEDIAKQTSEWFKNLTDEEFSEWRQSVREGKERAGCKNFGRPTYLSDGRLCDSQFEAEIGQYLIDRGVSFELHRPLDSRMSNRKVETDFYVDGLYIEVDGLWRPDDYFREKKYGDLPFVVLRPDDWKYAIDAIIMGDHVENGIKIIEIDERPLPGRWGHNRAKTYDVVMADTGPANFLANGVVSHNSFAYAFVGGWQAWIKRYFLQYFLKASVSYNPSEIRTYAVYGKKHGVQILPPDINKSGQGFVVEGKNIRAPLGIIANVGPRAEQEVLEGQPWSSIDDFEARTSGRHAKRINVYKNLIIAGAFDSLESDRKALLEKMYRNKGKVGEYGDVHLDVDISTRALISKAEEQIMGYSFSFNPIEEVADSLNTPAISTAEGIEEVAVGERSTVYGKVTNIRPYKSKSGTMAWVTLQLLDDTEISITMFADLFQQVSHLFELSDVILVRFSRTADFRDQPSYVANEMINMTSYLS